MQVACPVCWHSVWTKVICEECGFVQCLEYEGPKCTNCGGKCRSDVHRTKEKITAAAHNRPVRE